MYEDFLRGELTQLVTMDPENDWTLFTTWSRDSEYDRFMDSTPARPLADGKAPEWVKEHAGLQFIIRTLEDDKPIGFIELDGIAWTRSNAYIAVGIGERDYWGRGYGEDAMRILLRYAFVELGMHRLSLSVFEYNTRAIRLYEKLGFQNEGRKRQFFRREGRRWDLIYMGLLKNEWEKLDEPQA